MSQSSSGRRKRLARVSAFLVSGLLMAALYRSLDIREIGSTLLGADPMWLATSIGVILPISVLRAVRFFLVAPVGALPGLLEALRLTLVSSAANLVLPAKAGDLIKSHYVATRGETSSGVAVAIVVYERLCDLFAVIAWCLVGFVVGRPEVPGLPQAFWAGLAAVGGLCAVLIVSERAAALVPAVIVRARLDNRFKRLHDLTEGWAGLLQLVRGRRRRIIPFSLLLWFVHLFQMWLFTVALGVPVPFTVCTSLSAVALMAGLIPFTIAGLGTRDVALVVLLARYMTRESAAAMGLLMATRSLVPALLGIPLVWPYLSMAMAPRASRPPAGQ
jgi:uncharacterized protein (TIRG00374 family)